MPSSWHKHQHYIHIKATNHQWQRVPFH